MRQQRKEDEARQRKRHGLRAKARKIAPLQGHAKTAGEAEGGLEPDEPQPAADKRQQRHAPGLAMERGQKGDDGERDRRTADHQTLRTRQDARRPVERWRSGDGHA